MTYLGRDGYRATAEEVAALPDYHEAFRQHGYMMPVGRYKKIAASTHEWAIIDVFTDPLSRFPREVFSHVQLLPPVRDQILTAVDDDYYFQKY